MDSLPADLPRRDTLDFISAALAPAAGKRVLDIGCGRGPLAKPLAALGAAWTGVDPVERQGDGPEVVTAGAERLPFADASFDAAVFVNSLHHVPLALMDQALAEAARVSSGVVIVVEPDITGDLAEVVRPVDDETEVRTAAQAAIARAVAAGLFTLETAAFYERHERFRDFAAFSARVVDVDPARAAAAEALGPALNALFLARAMPVEGGFVLRQPMRGHVLRPVRAAA